MNILGTLLLALVVHTPSAFERRIEQSCYAVTAYTESRGEGVAGMAAVMEAMRERAADSRHRWPRTICGVATQRAQFSGLEHWDPRHVDKVSWYSAYELAALALDGVPLVPPQCRGAVFFDAHSRRSGALCSIGNHVFYGASK